ncbi:MAG TPA: hypothetical protein VLB49_12350 [Gemmatimonadales bacterium]|nr:hypothetical protein [Gemmatimonadales bacterium]
MRHSVRSSLITVFLASAAILTACVRPVNTVPVPAAPTDPVQYYDLDVPSELDIKAVDFDAALFTAVSGTGDAIGSSVGGRGFLKVYAVHRKTGEQYLLLYENIPERKRPVQVIRFHGVPNDPLLEPRGGRD